ncbi:MAG: nucleotide exchange factor GrpE [Spirochaetaceae bacterium]|jgi:molecular chaperone GrpE|nr:nucleotide exchange factor GrpE [Spirochaetaceae bacterium]
MKENETVGAEEISPDETTEAGDNQPKKTPEQGSDVENDKTEPVGADNNPPDITELEAQVADLKDQYLRKAAEFENFRKRLLKDKQDAIDFANQRLFEDLIPIIDDFERAIKSAEASSTVEEPDSEENKAFKAMYEGISMIEKRLVSTLESKWGLKRFDSEGEPFDPNKHEALMMETSPDVEEDTVGADLIKGYMLKDRVIRPAKVKVIKPE